MFLDRFALGALRSRRKIPYRFRRPYEMRFYRCTTGSRTRCYTRYRQKRFSGLFFISRVSVFSFRFVSFPATRFYYSSAKRLAETRRLSYCFVNNLKHENRWLVQKSRRRVQRIYIYILTCIYIYVLTHIPVYIISLMTYTMYGPGERL